jgi:hypothetical protein
MFTYLITFYVQFCVILDVMFILLRETASLYNAITLNKAGLYNLISINILVSFLMLNQATILYNLTVT